MIAPFDYTAAPVRVLFGQGRFATLPDAVTALGLDRVLILASPRQADLVERARALLGDRIVATFSGARMHTPVAVTNQAEAVARQGRIDGIVSIGGGSTIGLGKALARRLDLKHLAIATTYAGSEMTPILGETVDQTKVTIRDERLRPQTVIYDVDLTLDLPVALSVTSGINAAAHAVEALYAKDRNPVIALMAAEALKAIATALPGIHRDPTDLAARSDALYGAWLAGTCLGAVSMSVHHKLCHVLGGSFDLPHAETHTVMLPHVVKFIAPAEPAAMQVIETALGCSDAAQGLFDLIGAVDGPRSLQQLGLREDQLELATDRTLENPYWTPVPLERATIRALLDRAFRGAPPA